MSDPLPTVVPVTIRVDRQLDHVPEVVFDAYADIDQRAQWNARVDEVVVFESHDFQVGGTDHFARSPLNGQSLSGITRYEHIVQNECLVFTERLVNSNDQLLAISLITWLIAPSETGARIDITDQTTSVVGSRPIEGTRYRYEVMLDRLTRHLADNF